MPRERGVALIGPGRLGQAMGRLLSQAGIPIVFVVSRRLTAARRAAGFIGSGRPLSFAQAAGMAPAGVVLLTTADLALAQVAHELAKTDINFNGKTVLHTCGSLPASVLDPLRRRGASIGSLHPYQTVPSPRAGVRNLSGCFWGIEGEPKARRVAERWVKVLGGVAFRVRPEQKTLYHASASLVCPTVVTLMDHSLRLLRRSGIRARVARPMLARFVAETAENFARLGARRALTGPAVRGDWQTLRRHLTALRRASPDIVPAYTELLRAMLRLSGRRAPHGLL